MNANVDGSNVHFPATTDASGNYNIELAPGTYSLDVAFSGSGSSSHGRRVAEEFELTTDTVKDLLLPNITLSGRVIDSLDNPVPDVQLSAIAFAQNNCCGGFDGINATSGPDGNFEVRILPNNYIHIALTLSPGSPFITTPLPDQAFLTR